MGHNQHAVIANDSLDGPDIAGQSHSVMGTSQAGNTILLDAAQSTYEGEPKGLTQGAHYWAFATSKNLLDIAAASSPITLEAGNNVIVSGVDATKSNSGNSWNSSFRSQQSKDPSTENFAVSWLVESVTGTVREMGGLDDNPDQNSSYSSIEYAIYQVNGNIYSRVYEGGAAIVIPGYQNIALQVGDRLGISVELGIVSYFHMRGDTVTIFYTSTKKANSPLFFKGALNRGAGSSGHSVMGDVTWHEGQMQVPALAQVSGFAGQGLSDQDLAALKGIGLDVQGGSTYAQISALRSASSAFLDGADYFPISVDHGYCGQYSQSQAQL